MSPSYGSIDLALSRQFRFHERHVFEVRADAFNISNSLIPATAALNGNPVQSSTAAPVSPSIPAFASLTSVNFGQIINAYPTRKIQFALKYTF